MEAVIHELIGQVFSNVVVSGNDDLLIFTRSDGTGFQFYHDQNCCESVYVESVAGDLNDLIDTPILDAMEVSNDGYVPECTQEEKEEYLYDKVEEWTFYKFRTIKGSVTVRWYGTSNGYYSTAVDFQKF